MTVLKKCYVLCAAVMTAGLLASGASADAGDIEKKSEAELFTEALKSGKPTMNVRLRYERADMDSQPKVGRAVTIRTRLGYETGDYHGFTGFIEMEDVTAADDDSYWDKVEDNNGHGVVADPEGTEINQSFLRYTAPDDFVIPGKVTAGRQRIILDDARFIGNVGWRQDEQTFDAFRATSSFGLEGLEVNTGYINHIRRIFAEDKDARSSSPFLNISYQAIPELKVTAFGYWLDFDGSLGEGSPQDQTSDTYGIRLNGSWAADDNITLGYQASWATQDEGEQSGAKSYDADYIMVDGSFGWNDCGTLGAGYEQLEDDGQVFHTGLATAHKFNGWADVFLNNGGNSDDRASGVGGLEDTYFYIAPKLPWGLKGKVVYHIFESESGSTDYGDEWDAVLIKPINKNWKVLLKYADFDADNDADNPYASDVERMIAQVEFSF